MNDEEQISAYVDGRMSEPERAAFEARLLADAALRRQVAVTRLLVDQSRQVERVQPPKNFILPQDYGKVAQPTSPAPRLNLRLLFFRLSSVAAAVIFMFAVAFDTLRTTLPAAPAPAAAPMAAQAPETSITTNVEPIVPTVAATQAPSAGAAVMPNATPMIETRSMMTEAQPSTEDQATASSAPPADAAGSVPMESAPSAKSKPLPATQAQANPAPAPQPASAQTEPLLSPLRIIAGVALLAAIVLGLIGWLRG